jgi:hypothetical protein
MCPLGLPFLPPHILGCESYKIVLFILQSHPKKHCISEWLKMKKRFRFIELYSVCVCVIGRYCHNRSNGQLKYDIGRWPNFYKVHQLKCKLNYVLIHTLKVVWSAKKYGTWLNNFSCTLFNLETEYETGQNRL